MNVIKITKHWTISRIIDLCPDAVEVLMDKGLQCFSCSSVNTERLNDGLKKHGFHDEEITQLVIELNEVFTNYQNAVLQEPTTDDYKVVEIKDLNSHYYQIGGLKFTKTAFDTLHELLENMKGLQIKLDNGGCSGYTYIYDFCMLPADDEYEFKLSLQLSIFMNKFTYNKLRGTIIDFTFGIKDAGLKFINPNVKNACHCGDSIGF